MKLRRYDILPEFQYLLNRAAMLLGLEYVQSPKIWLIRGLVKFVPAR